MLRLKKKHVINMLSCQTERILMNYFKKQLIIACVSIAVGSIVSSMPCHWKILGLQSVDDCEDLRNHEKKNTIKQVKDACKLQLKIVSGASDKMLEKIDEESKAGKQFSRIALQLSSSAPVLRGFSPVVSPIRSNSGKQGEELREDLRKRILNAAAFILKILNVEPAGIEKFIKEVDSIVFDQELNQSDSFKNNSNVYDGDDSDDEFGFFL